MDAARQHGSLLPIFPSHSDAERALYGKRDQLLQELIAAAEQSEMFSPTFEPESLKNIERWYFDLYERDAFAQAGIARERLEQAIAMYVGETAVRSNPDFQWFVSEYPFAQGKYELGIRKPLFSWMLRSFTDLYARRGNKRRQSIWRQFQQHAA